MRALLLAFLLSATACAPFTRRATASVEEYTLYRRFRTADQMEGKLVAGYEYLEKNPLGRWKGEVRGWFNRAEEEYLRKAWGDVRALRTFVDSVPRSPRAKRAAARVIELEASRAHEERGARAFEERVGELQERLEAAEKGRRELVTGVAAWARRLASFRDWGVRTHEMSHELIHAFRLAEPGARCDGQGCTKTISVEYAIPEDKTQSGRQAIYDVKLALADGGIREWSLSGPDLWSRIGEAIYLRSVATLDYGARAEALAKAVQTVAVAIEPKLPQSRCGLDAVSPVLLHRRCDGVEFQMLAAIELGDEDRIVMRASEALPVQGAPSEATDPVPLRPDR